MQDAVDNHYFDLFNLIPVSYCTISAEGRILAANLRAAELLGIPQNKLKNTQISSLVAAEDHELFAAFKRRLTATGEPQELEIRFSIPGKEQIWVYLEARCKRNEQGAKICHMVFRDISQVKRMQNLQQFLAQTSSGNFDEPFFAALARYLAHSLNMDCVYIEHLDKEKTQASPVAFWCDGRFVENQDFALEDSVRSETIARHVCCISSGVREHFPQDMLLQGIRAESYAGISILDQSGEALGLISAMSRKPLAEAKSILDILNMVTVRVVGEFRWLKAAEALRESEARFEALHNASFGGIAIHDQGVILECNQGLSDMMGYTREELIGMYGYMLIAPESRKLILENVRNDYEKPYEAYGLRKNGEIFPMRLEARVIPYKGKQIRSVEFRDLTQQKLAEKMLSESEEDLKQAQRIARLGSWRLDVATSQVQWSEELYKVYGFDPAQPPPPYTEHHKLFTPESWERLSAALAKTASTGIPYELELETTLKHGKQGWMWVYGHAVTNAAGEITQIRGAAQDITERKLAEQEKEKMQLHLNQAHKMEMLGQLAGSVAHDFNNLLTVIMGYSAELSNEPNLKRQLKQDAEEIFKAGARAKELTQKLLTFSKKQVIQAEKMNLNAVITNLHGVFKRLIGVHIRIKHQLSAQTAFIYADAGQIEQVLINLMLNSRDAMPQGGEITIQTKILSDLSPEIARKFQVRPGKYVMLSFQDNGCGISEQNLNRLFEPFFTTKEIGKGIGLGLANLHSIIKTYHGGLCVESELGKGTTFQILLPYCQESSSKENPADADADLNGNGEHILIVDDEEALSAFFKKMISKLGYVVTVANSGAEALMKLGKGLQPALVITDIIMPGMNGKQLADRIMKLNPDQKILFISGFTDDIIEPLGLQKEGIPFIQKPFTTEQLARKMKQILAGKIQRF